MDKRRRFLDFMRQQGFVNRAEMPAARREATPAHTPKYESGGNLRVRGIPGGPQNRAYQQLGPPSPEPTVTPTPSFTPQQTLDIAQNAAPASYITPEMSLVMNDPEIARQVAVNNPLPGGRLFRGAVDAVTKGVSHPATALDIENSGGPAIWWLRGRWKAARDAYEQWARDPNDATLLNYVLAIVNPFPVTSLAGGGKKWGADPKRAWGESMYQLITTGQQSNYDAYAVIDPLVIQWAKEHPEAWPRIKRVYESGYGRNPDGTPKYTGGQAVWEYLVSTEFTGPGFSGWLARATGDIQANPVSWGKYRLWDKIGW